MRSLLYFSSELLKPTPAFLVVSSASLFGLPISPDFSKIPGFTHKLKNPQTQKPQTQKHPFPPDKKSSQKLS